MRGKDRFYLCRKEVLNEGSGSFVPFKPSTRWFKRNDALVLNQQPFGFKPMESLLFCTKTVGDDV
jgi:hypothetical protein